MNKHMSRTFKLQSLMFQNKHNVSDFKLSERHSCVYFLEKLRSLRTSELPTLRSVVHTLFDPDRKEERAQHTEEREINEGRKRNKKDNRTIRMDQMRQNTEMLAQKKERWKFRGIAERCLLSLP